MLAAEWDPLPERPPPPDTDGDGVLDADDACPGARGVASSDAKKNGCPPPLDTDGDGILDDVDACPTEPGVSSSDQRLKGCQPPPPPAPAGPPDADGDGIADDEDQCLLEAGGEGAPGQKRGCPAPLDADGDGIFDDADACPIVPGSLNPDAKKNGCPLVRVTEQRIEILERIEFERGKATLKPESEPVLSAVAAALTQNPQIVRLSVEGHTDSRGSAALNRELSRERAVAVVDWLIGHGIAAKRLVGVGFGPDHPIETNTTDEGRQNNRRVEFRVIELGQQPAAPGQAVTP